MEEATSTMEETAFVKLVCTAMLSYHISYTILRDGLAIIPLKEIYVIAMSN